MSEPRSFTCEMCRETFESGWTDEEAHAEASANGFDGIECGVVCDDCYRKTPWGAKEQVS